MFDPGELGAILECVKLKIASLEEELDEGICRRAISSYDFVKEVKEELEGFEQLKEKIRSEMNYAMFNPGKSRGKK